MENVNELIRDNIQSALKSKKLNVRELASRSNINQPTLARYLSGVIIDIKVSQLQNIAKALELNTEDLYADLNTTAYRTSVSDDYIRVRFYDASASAGRGNDAPVTDVPIDILSIKKEWLDRHYTNINPENLSLIKVEGDSMFPTLKDGDIIMVDHNVNKFSFGSGVYVILDKSEMLKVKRLDFDKYGNLEVISDNAAYKKVIYSKDELVSGLLTIIGKVIWQAGDFTK